MLRGKSSARTVRPPVSGRRVSGTSRNRTWVRVRDQRRCAQGPSGGLSEGGRKAGERQGAGRSGRAAALRCGSEGPGHGGRSESTDSHIGVWSPCGHAHARATLVQAGCACCLAQTGGKGSGSEVERLGQRRSRVGPEASNAASRTTAGLQAPPQHACNSRLPGAREREARLQAQLADLQRTQYGHASERTPPGRGSRWTGWAAAWTTRALIGCSAQ